MGILDDMSWRKRRLKGRKVEIEGGKSSEQDRCIFILSACEETDYGSNLTVSGVYKGARLFLLNKNWDKQGMEVESSFAFGNAQVEENAVKSFLAIMQELLKAAEMDKEGILEYFNLQ